MERLASRIRLRTLRAPEVLEKDLAAMARDPTIQHGLQQIQTESAAAEADGLGPQ